MGGKKAAPKDDVPPEILAAREKLKARMGGGGGPGVADSMPRAARGKKLNRTPIGGADDKQMQAQLKRLGCNSIPAIEEVNMFKEDGNVIHFVSPKVHAAVAANTFAIQGPAEEKRLEELLPGIINQLGPDSLVNLKRIAESFAANKEGKPGDDDDIPDIGESFEEVSKQDD